MYGIKSVYLARLPGTGPGDQPGRSACGGETRRWRCCADPRLQARMEMATCGCAIPGCVLDVAVPVATPRRALRRPRAPLDLPGTPMRAATARTEQKRTIYIPLENGPEVHVKAGGFVQWACRLRLHVSPARQQTPLRLCIYLGFVAFLRLPDRICGGCIYSGQGTGQWRISMPSYLAGTPRARCPSSWLRRVVADN